MAYNESIDARVRAVLSAWENTEAKKMFGGVCHLLNGNMVCGVLNDFLILRLGEQRAVEALSRPSVRPFDLTGRPMKGWVMVHPEGFGSEAVLEKWLLLAKEFVDTLPPKRGQTEK